MTPRIKPRASIPRGESAKDFWDKLQIALIPLTVLLVGSVLAYVQKNSENDVRFVEIATSVLREEPTGEKLALRSWAIDVLASKSPVPLSPDVRANLLKVKVSFDIGYTGSSYKNIPSAYAGKNTNRGIRYEGDGGGDENIPSASAGKNIDRQ